MEFFKNLKRYLHANLVWLIRIQSLWGVALPLALLFIVIFLPWNLANLVRYIGLALELLGIITVAIGLKGKRELFKKPSFIEHLKSWWNQRPKWKLVSSMVSATFDSSSSVSGSCSGSAWHGATNLTIKSRLDAVEKNLSSLRNELQAFELDTNTKHTKVVKNLESERQTRESSVQEIRTQIEDLAARDITFEALGVYWLFWGLVFSSLSSEVSTLINFLK